MKNFSKNILFAIVLSFLANAPISYAQSISAAELENISAFKLNSDKESAESFEVVPSKTESFISEYKLSLGSQILDYQNTSRVFPSEAEHIETGFKGLSSNVKLDDSDIKYNTSLEKDLGAVITLNNSYENNSIGFNDMANSAVTISGKTGKLSLYGEYNQSNHLVASSDSNSSSNFASARASMVSGSNMQSEDKITTSISSDYYLEAVYSFKPTLKGKVAFKKTMIDTFDSKENVEVEGIVEASSDVSIKAGYSNENRPEVETNATKEKKVWTEFILKF